MKTDTQLLRTIDRPFEEAQRSRLCEAVRLLNAEGFRVVAQLPDGAYDIGPSDVDLIKSDPLQWLANRYKKDKRTVRKWVEYSESLNQCTGKTASGRQCKIHGEISPSLETFKTGVTDRCKYHADYDYE